MLSRFVTKGTVSAVLAVIAFWLSRSGHAAIAETLKDPSFVEGVMGAIGSVLMVYAGVAQGVTKPSEVATVAKELAPNLTDPYPGWDFDPIKGWVQVDASGK